MSWGWYVLLGAVAIVAALVFVLDRIGAALQRYESERSEWE